MVRQQRVYWVMIDHPSTVEWVSVDLKSDGMGCVKQVSADGIKRLVSY